MGKGWKTSERSDRADSAPFVMAEGHSPPAPSPAGILPRSFRPADTGPAIPSTAGPAFAALPVACPSLLESSLSRRRLFDAASKR